MSAADASKWSDTKIATSIVFTSQWTGGAGSKSLFRFNKGTRSFFWFFQTLNRWVEAKSQFSVPQEVTFVRLWSFQGRWKGRALWQWGSSCTNCASNTSIFLGSWVTKGNLSFPNTCDMMYPLCWIPWCWGQGLLQKDAASVKLDPL